MSADAHYTEEQRDALVEQSITNPAPPEALQFLQVGPDLEVEYEGVQATPLSMEDPLLRALSPFVVQVEPPLVFASDASYQDSSQSGSAAVGVYGSARSGSSAFSTARENLSRATYTGGNYSAGSAEGAIAKSYAQPETGRTGSGEPVSAGGVSSNLGDPSIADLNVAVDIAMQLAAVLKTPPLVMLINPQSLNMTYTKIQQYSDRSRYGYIFHAWGEEQPRMAISARCGAYISAGRGVHVASKRDSKAWQNLMGLFHLYRNNGYIYDTVGKSNAHHFVGALSIQYDGWIYYGHLESFNWAEDESNQLGGVVFDMEFVVSMVVDTTEPSYNVSPMKSPTPNTDDQRYVGAPNEGYNGPGVFNPLEGFDGSIVGGTQSGLSSVSGGGGGSSAGTSSAGAGSSGFQPPSGDPPGVVEEADVGEGQIEPFRVG